MLSRLEPKHWALISGYLTSIALVVGGLDHWHDLLNPPIVAGLVTLTATFIGALFAGAPQNPNLSALANPGRRDSDPPPLAAVADVLRKTP